MDIINLKNQLEIDFKEIISNKNECDKLLLQISDIIEKINIKYNTLLENINLNENLEIPIYLGIDSLNFQNKFYIIKLNNIKKLYNRILNRIYGDYFKIYKLIITHSALLSQLYIDNLDDLNYLPLSVLLNPQSLYEYAQATHNLDRY